MKLTSQFLFPILALAVFGCSKETPKGPVAGTLQLEKLTPEQQIAKVESDKTIPENYKQTFINSIKARQAQGSMH